MRDQTFFIGITLAALATIAPAAATPVYHAIVLGLADGRTDLQVANGVALNKWGQVLGTYGAPQTNGTHAVLWTPAFANDGSGVGATLFPIENSPGMPPGTASTFPNSLNDRGQVVGTTYTPGGGDGNHALSWMWRPTTLNSTKGVLHGASGITTAFALLTDAIGEKGATYSNSINNHGVIVAAAFGHPALWNPTAPNGTIGTWTLDTTNAGSPSGINDSGRFVGSSCAGGAPWNGPYAHIGALPMSPTDTITSSLWLSPNGPTCVGGANAINANGDILINAVSTTNVIDTYIDKAGTITDLNPGNGGAGGAFNNFDQVLGSLFNGSNHATLMQAGQVLDLNNLTDATNGLVFSSGVAINDAGQILARGLYPGAQAPTLLTPFALVTNPVHVAVSPPVTAGATTTIAVTLTNNGTTPITGPVSLALDKLTPGVTLNNATGTTFFTGPGSPYADISATDLPPGATTAAFTLVFNNPRHKAINFTGRPLGTSSPR